MKTADMVATVNSEGRRSRASRARVEGIESIIMKASAESTVPYSLVRLITVTATATP